MKTLEVRNRRKKRSWDLYFLEMCRLVASKSPDPSTKCGCVVVGPDNEVRSTGYNGPPRGVELTPAREERPEKYFWYEHAECNAIFNAARVGIAMKGCTAYVTGTPCPKCVRAFIQAGITQIVTPLEGHNPKHNEGWKKQYERSFSMLLQANIQTKKVRTSE